MAGSVTDRHLQFINLGNPNDAKDGRKMRQARSHAIKQALQQKRNLQRATHDNFRVLSSVTFKEASCKKRSCPAPPPRTLSADNLDPFQTLAVDASRLQMFLNDYKVRQAAEPVFSVAKELSFHSFQAVFQSGWDDPALLNAMMLTFSLEVNGGRISSESLTYQSQAISHIRERLTAPEATSAKTIGAILLLAGVEVRRAMPAQAQIHMRAIQQLLDICRTDGIHLGSGIKRAIFWQDLNAAITSGSHRIVDHTTFEELQWKRDPFSRDYFQLPRGFQPFSSLLTPDFREVLEDVNALQRIRDFSTSPYRDMVSMSYINNHLASIQSRLQRLVQTHSLLECCRLGAYLSASMLCCTIWCAQVIPVLSKFKETTHDPVWDDHPELLAWLLYIGGAFSVGSVRSEYVGLIQQNNYRFRDLFTSWAGLEAVLGAFFWSNVAFTSHVKALWEDCVDRS